MNKEAKQMVDQLIEQHIISEDNPYIPSAIEYLQQQIDKGEDMKNLSNTDLAKQCGLTTLPKTVGQGVGAGVACTTGVLFLIHSEPVLATACVATSAVTNALQNSDGEWGEAYRRGNESVKAAEAGKRFKSWYKGIFSKKESK